MRLLRPRREVEEVWAALARKGRYQIKAVSKRTEHVDLIVLQLAAYGIIQLR